MTVTKLPQVNESPSTSQPHPELQKLRTKLDDILKALPFFGSTVLKPPIIDASVDISGESSEDNTQQHETIPGLRALRDAVRRDLDVLDKFLADSRCASLPALSTNAPYLISVWNEVLLAPRPVATVWSTFSESGKTVHSRRRGNPKEDGVKVDVVANGRQRWIRVNTIKNSRILAEFREIDSYLTDSSDDEEISEDGRPTLAQTEFDNSVLRMGRSLLIAARENPVGKTSIVPSITMQLTRLDPSAENKRDYDPRISQTIDELRKLGIEVRLGEREDAHLSTLQEECKPIRARRLEPTTRINLDLSILIALVSDLTHSPLPASAKEADARFTPSAQYLEWKMNRMNVAAPTENIDIESIARPSRALSNQALQEMIRGLLQEIHERLSPLGSSSHSSSPSCSTTPTDIPSPKFPEVEFWTTPEARDRCLKIISKIGGPNEKRRAQALFSSTATPPMSLTEAEESFWRGSRYENRFIPLLPIRLLPSSEPDESLQPPSIGENGRPLSPFFASLANTCRAILAQETVPDPRTLRSSAETSTGLVQGVSSEKRPEDVDNEDDGEIQRAIVTKANPRLTAHTVQSMLWGAVKGWTTLTANKTSVKAMLREMKVGNNGLRWDRSDASSKGDTSNGEQLAEDLDGADVAALWVVDPRSLAEGMRADFGTI